MTQHQTTEHDIIALHQAVKGRVITPGKDGYEQARAVFLGGIDRRPGVIVKVEGPDDIAATISWAAEKNIEIAVRSGGHSSAAHGLTDGGVVIDLREMDALEIDRDGRTVWAETGLTTGAYTQATAEHGLATGFGDTGTVGIGGITLSGGIGYLVRKHGLAIDNLLAAEIATADGRVLRVDEETEPELFWAIRGGGGNFGVVTRFQFRLHPVDKVTGGMMILPLTPEVLTGALEVSAAASDDLSTIVSALKAPPLPFLPPEVHGKPAVIIGLVHAGRLEEGEEAVEPFRRLAEPIADMVQPMPYQQMFPPEEEEFHPILRNHITFLDRFDSSLAQTVAEYVAGSTAEATVVQLRVLGGAVARVPEEATAFAHRHRKMMANLALALPESGEPEPHEEWLARLAGELESRAGATGSYIGFLGDVDPTRVRQAYPGKTWERLVAVKAKYDPGNLFRRNHNVPPRP